MNLLFVVTGIGYGDATRVDAIISSILKKHPKAKIMIAAYDNSYNYFKQKFPVIKIKGYKFTGGSMRFSIVNFLMRNYFLPLSWISNIRKIKSKTKKFKPGLIISDFEPIGIPLAKSLKIKCITIFGFDPVTFNEIEIKDKKLLLQARYLENLYNKSDGIIIPSLLGKKSRKDYISVNPIIRTIPSNLPSKSSLMKELKLKKKPILVMLGGSSFGKKLVKELSVLVHFYNENFIVFGFKHQLKFKSKKIKHILFKEDFLKYLKVSKGIITLAGHKTMTEALIYKKPMLIFPIKNHVEQLMNAYLLRNLAIVNHDIKNIKISLDLFLNNLNNIKSKIPKIKANGAEEVVSIIEKITK